jgi:hypothetical protein
MDESAFGTDARNTDDILAHDLKTGRYEAGADLRGKNIDAQEMGRRGQGRVMDTAYGQGNFQDQFGNQSLGQAKTGFDQTHQQEAASAGWGKKWLAGMGAAAINTLAPGAGALIPGQGGNQAQLPWGGQQQQPGYNPNYTPPKVDTSAAGWGRTWTTRPQAVAEKGGVFGLSGPESVLIGEKEPEIVIPISHLKDDRPSLGDLMGYRKSSNDTPPPASGSPETDSEFRERIHFLEGTRSEAENRQVKMQSRLQDRIRNQGARKASIDAIPAEEQAWAQKTMRERAKNRQATR